MPEEPCVKARLVGETLTVNVDVGAAVTLISYFRYEETPLASTPSSSIQLFPWGTELFAVSVSTLDPVVVGFGLKVAVIPEGKTGALKVTGAV